MRAARLQAYEWRHSLTQVVDWQLLHLRGEFTQQRPQPICLVAMVSRLSKGHYHNIVCVDVRHILWRQLHLCRNLPEMFPEATSS